MNRPLPLCPVCSEPCRDGVGLRIHLASRHSPQEYRIEVRQLRTDAHASHAVEVVRGEEQLFCSRVTVDALAVLPEPPGAIPTCGRCRSRLPSGVGAFA